MNLATTEGMAAATGSREPLRAPVADDGGALETVLDQHQHAQLDESFVGTSAAARIAVARELVAAKPPEAYCELAATDAVRTLADEFGATLGEHLSTDDALTSRTVALLSTWSSSDTLMSPLGGAIRIAASAIFGVANESTSAYLASVERDVGAEAKHLASEHHEGFEWFLMSQYERTQALLGGRPFVAYRGILWHPYTLRRTDPQLWPLTSFAATVESAASFTSPYSLMTAGRPEDAEPTVLVACVPAARVLSTSTTGLSSSGEAEIVVLGPGDGVVDECWTIPASANPDFTDVWETIAKAAAD
jgi:hypothetical protein